MIKYTRSLIPTSLGKYLFLLFPFAVCPSPFPLHTFSRRGNVWRYPSVISLHSSHHLFGIECFTILLTLLLPHSERRPRDPRLRLVRTYSTIELVQLSEFLKHVVLLIETDLYPSNSVIEASHNFSPKAVAKIAWGYGAGYRYLVDDLLKYSPLDLLYLFENTYTKTERAEYLIAQGLAFEDAPATLERAISCVSFERQALDPTGGLKNLFYPALTPRSHMAKQQENVRYGIADYEGQDGYLEDDPYNHDGDRSGMLQS
jgi:hypothetical protein